MTVLVDTHTLLWFAADDPRLSRIACDQLTDSGNERLLSMASVWELAIKISIGKLKLDARLEDFIAEVIRRAAFRLLPVTIAHSAAVSRLPFVHRGPFDRMLAAQALTEQVQLISADRVFDQYAVKRLW